MIIDQLIEKLDMGIDACLATNTRMVRMDMSDAKVMIDILKRIKKLHRGGSDWANDLIAEVSWNGEQKNQ